MNRYLANRGVPNLLRGLLRCKWWAVASLHWILVPTDSLSYLGWAPSLPQCIRLSPLSLSIPLLGTPTQLC